MDGNGIQPATAAPAATGTQPTMTELVSGIMTDAQTLIKQNMTMLRAELKEDVRRTKDAAKYMGIGVGVAALGGLFLLVSLVYLLQWLFPTLHLAACWAIVGGLFVLAGAVAFFVGKKMFDSFNPLPDKSLNAFQENLSWITKTNRPS